MFEGKKKLFPGAFKHSSTAANYLCPTGDLNIRLAFKFQVSISGA